MHNDDDVKASVVFGRLRGNVWERNGIRLDAKLKVYKAVKSCFDIKDIKLTAITLKLRKIKHKQ